MQSTVYMPAQCNGRYFDPSEIFATGLPNVHHDLLHYASYVEGLSTEMPCSHLPKDQPPSDLSSPRTAASVYNGVEGYQSSSPEHLIQSPSPQTTSPNTLIPDTCTPTEEEILLDPSLTMFATFQDIQNNPFLGQRPQGSGIGEQSRPPELQEIPICWDHECNGRVFSSWSNLRRHQRERASQAPKCHCPRCGAHFSRTTARNQHLANMSCKRIRRYSNGRLRPSTQKIQETYGWDL